MCLNPVQGRPSRKATERHTHQSINSVYSPIVPKLAPENQMSHSRAVITVRGCAAKPALRHAAAECNTTTRYCFVLRWLEKAILISPEVRKMAQAALLERVGMGDGVWFVACASSGTGLNFGQRTGGLVIQWMDAPYWGLAGAFQVLRFPCFEQEYL